MKTRKKLAGDGGGGLNRPVSYRTGHEGFGQFGCRAALHRVAIREMTFTVCNDGLGSTRRCVKAVTTMLMRLTRMENQEAVAVDGVMWMSVLPVDNKEEAIDAEVLRYRTEKVTGLLSPIRPPRSHAPTLDSPRCPRNRMQ